MYIFSHLFLSVWTLDIYSSDYNPILRFIVQVVSALAIWEFFLVLTLMSLWHIPISVGFLFLIITFWHHRSSSFILCVSCPSPRFSHLSKKLWFIFSKSSIRNQDLSARCALCYWGVITFRPCQLTARCVCTDLCVHTSTHSCICVGLNMSSCWCCRHWPMTTWVSAAPFFIFVYILLLLTPTIHYHVCNHLVPVYLYQHPDC